MGLALFCDTHGEISRTVLRTVETLDLLVGHSRQVAFSESHPGRDSRLPAVTPRLLAMILAWRTIRGLASVLLAQQTGLPTWRF